MNTYITIGFIIIVIWNIVLTVLMFLQKRFFNRFTKGISKHDLKTILKNIAKSLKTIDQELSDVDQAIKTINRDNRLHFQKIGFVRFNPFSDTGGDQSFCLCLLDQDQSGFIITSLHSREQTRIYAKPVTSGKSEQSELSKEEAESLKRALQYGAKTEKMKK